MLCTLHSWPSLIVRLCLVPYLCFFFFPRPNIRASIDAALMIAVSFLQSPFHVLSYPSFFFFGSVCGVLTWWDAHDLSINSRIWHFVFSYFPCLTVTYLESSWKLSSTPSIWIEIPNNISLYTKAVLWILPGGGHPPRPRETRTESKWRKFFSSKANSHSFIPSRFLFPHFLPDSPRLTVHLPRPTFSRSFSSFSQTLHISLSAPSEPRTLSHFTYTSRFSAISKRLAFFWFFTWFPSILFNCLHWCCVYFASWVPISHAQVKTLKLMNMQSSEGNTTIPFLERSSLSSS